MTRNVATRTGMALVCMAALSTAGCWPFPIGDRTPPRNADTSDKAVLELSLPHIRDAEVIEAYVRYEVENPDCVPTDYTRAIGGTKVSTRHQIRIPVERVAEGRHVAVFHRDHLQDAVLYALHEPCRWKPSIAWFAVDPDITVTELPSGGTAWSGYWRVHASIGLDDRVDSSVEWCLVDTPGERSPCLQEPSVFRAVGSVPAEVRLRPFNESMRQASRTLVLPGLVDEAQCLTLSEQVWPATHGRDGSVAFLFPESSTGEGIGSQEFVRLRVATEQVRAAFADVADSYRTVQREGLILSIPKPYQRVPPHAVVDGVSYELLGRGRLQPADAEQRLIDLIRYVQRSRSMCDKTEG